MIGLCRRIGDCDQHLSGRLLVMPAPLDRGEFRWLTFVDVIAVEMSEQDLDWDEHGREE